MKLYAPHKTTWWVSTILVAIGILYEMGITLGNIRSFAEGLPILGLIILLLATSMEGLQKLHNLTND
jgi:hypothetical protein